MYLIVQWKNRLNILCFALLSVLSSRFDLCWDAGLVVAERGEGGAGLAVLAGVQRPGRHLAGEAGLAGPAHHRRPRHHLGGGGAGWAEGVGDLGRDQRHRSTRAARTRGHFPETRHISHLDIYFPVTPLMSEHVYIELPLFGIGSVINEVYERLFTNSDKPILKRIKVSKVICFYIAGLGKGIFLNIATCNLQC